jgi:hypothetical protein
MRAARDVAGFDFASGGNPKTFNPVLFALGTPGCGKTVTAHAVGNYFLNFCQERGVRSRFLVIQRTMWASSYQNAPANNLVKIFAEQVRDFDGVAGIYWPDIDTAFAARENPGIRSEEKNILGACFGVFDGTLLPKNGKWFMICDANDMNMDEATVSRITQEPYVLKGAVTSAQRVELLRDVKLRKYGEFLELSEDEWTAIGDRCAELELSGRSLDNISRKVTAQVEDFEYPEEHFSADFERRRAIIAESSQKIDMAGLMTIVDGYATFEKESEAAAERERFERQVSELVFNLSAREKAAALYGAVQGR